jgi:hypothetical protein
VADSRKTYHEYIHELPDQEKQSVRTIEYGEVFRAIESAYPGKAVYSIPGMNELYVSALGGNGSDRVFETPHIDGLFAVLPGCVVLRCIVGIQGNRGVDTRFPLSGHMGHVYQLETGDYLAFDYNRSIHYIQSNDFASLDDRRRMILKLHYLVVPEWMPSWAVKGYQWLHTRYNAFLRGLFLKSQLDDSAQDADADAEKRQEIQDQQEIEAVLSKQGGIRCALLESDKVIAAGINGGTDVYVQVFVTALFLWRCVFGRG